MKDLFLTFLNLLDCRGTITEAELYKGGTFSKIVVENESGVYTVSIVKEKTDE